MKKFIALIALCSSFSGFACETSLQEADSYYSSARQNFKGLKEKYAKFPGGQDCRSNYDLVEQIEDDLNQFKSNIDKAQDKVDNVLNRYAYRQECTYENSLEAKKVNRWIKNLKKESKSLRNEAQELIRCL